jgi:hypothetical protein
MIRPCFICEKNAFICGHLEPELLSFYLGIAERLDHAVIRNHRTTEDPPQRKPVTSERTHSDNSPRMPWSADYARLQPKQASSLGRVA